MRRFAILQTANQISRVKSILKSALLRYQRRATKDKTVDQGRKTLQNAMIDADIDPKEAAETTIGDSADVQMTIENASSRAVTAQELAEQAKLVAEAAKKNR